MVLKLKWIAPKPTFLIVESLMADSLSVDTHEGVMMNERETGH